MQITDIAIRGPKDSGTARTTQDDNSRSRKATGNKPSSNRAANRGTGARKNRKAAKTSPNPGRRRVSGRTGPDSSEANKAATAQLTMGGPVGGQQILDVDRPHHPYSPSWLQSGEACPCYRSRDSKHERTIAGTIAHKASEKQEDDNRLSDDDALAVAECLDFYDSRLNELQGQSKVIAGSESYLPIDDLVF